MHVTDTQLANYLLNNGYNGIGKRIRMPGNNYVPSSDLRAVWQAAFRSIQTIGQQPRFDVSAFFSKIEWHSWPTAKRIAYGRCLKYFCDHKFLPIRVINPGKGRKRIYAYHSAHETIYRMIGLGYSS